MTARRFLSSIHLTAGSVAGSVILVLSVTGMLLAYKRQIIDWADRGFQSLPATGAQRLPLEVLLAKVQAAERRMPSGITVRSDASAPVAFDFGRERTLFVDSYTGQPLGEESLKLREFFSKVEDLHRWLGASKENRQLGRAITGASTLTFLVLVTTGPFLWWPKQWTWNNLKKITLLRGGPWVRARDWNWHNTLGFWCAVPLFMIVITGVIMSYGWANNLLYRFTGSRTPVAQARPRLTEELQFEGLGKQFVRAEQQVPGWESISVHPQSTPTSAFTFSIDLGKGNRPDLRSQLTLDAQGGVVLWEPFSSYNRGRQLRAWTRFTHTGEALGLPGQTVAAAASVGASILALTGLSLAIRRFVLWKSRGQTTDIVIPPRMSCGRWLTNTTGLFLHLCHRFDGTRCRW